MIFRSVSEWGYLPVEPDGYEAFTRLHADRLLTVARASKLGGEEGSGVLTDQHRRLRAQQVVGVLAAEGCTLEILPKIEGLGTGEDEASRTRIRDHLVHMLAVAYDLDLAVGATTNLGVQHRTLLEVLIGVFCDRLTDVLRHGIPRSYVAHEEELPALRGRLDAQRQFTRLAASPHRLACRYDAFSPDVALNQVMKATILRLSSIARSPSNQGRLRELADVYADVTAVPVKALRWEAIVLDRTNHRWRTLRDLARLLLAGDYQSTSQGGALGFSLLFAMNDLFESYVARMFKRALRGTDLQVLTQDRRVFCLVEADGARRFQVRPDILVRRGTSTVMIVDTKWKRISSRIDDPKQGVSQGDIYQMMAYGRLYSCPKLMLLYPHHTGLTTEGEAGRYTVCGSTDELVIASIDVTNPVVVDKLRALCGAGVTSKDACSGLAGRISVSPT